jgi:hypothetical protein
MLEKARKAREEHSRELSLIGWFLAWGLCGVIALVASVSVIVIVAGNGSNQKMYSSSDLIPGVVALAAMVFNLSKLHDVIAASKTRGKKEFLHIYMLFTLATAFLTLFMFLVPALANMKDPYAAFWIPLVVTAGSLFAACFSLVRGIYRLICYMWSQWRDSGDMAPQPEGSNAVEQKGEAGSEVAKNADKQDKQS